MEAAAVMQTSVNSFDASRTRPNDNPAGVMDHQSFQVAVASFVQRIPA